MKKITAILLVVSVLLVALCGCAKKENADTEVQDDKITIGLPVYTMEHPYYIEFVETAKATAEEKGVELLVIDSSLDAVKQVSNTENMMQQGVDALIITAVDPQGIIPTLDDAAERGIKLIIEGTPLTKNDEAYGDTFVGVDNYTAAKEGGIWAGNYAKEHLGGSAEIAILSFPVDPACQQREAGFIDGVTEILGDNAHIVANQNGEAVRDKSMSVMENILTANPDINLVYGINDDSALGAYAAMETRGMGDNQEAVVSFDGTADGRAAIEKDGMFKCAIYQSPSEIAVKCIEACIDAVNGEELPEHIAIPTQLITAENVKEFQ